MSDAMVPSYRVQRDASGVPWRMLAMAGGLLAAGAAGAGGWWIWQSVGASRTVPVIEADARPFKVRPDDPGGLRVPNQSELVLDRPAGRVQTPAQAGRPVALAPEAEAPNLDRLRAAVAPPPPVISLLDSEPAQQAATGASVPLQPVAPAPAPVLVPAAAPPPPAPVGRVQVQLGALPTEAAARAEWERLARRAPELLDGRTPQILRLDRGEGQTPMFRLRTGGLPDQDAAAQFCEQIRSRGGACIPVRG